MDLTALASIGAGIVACSSTLATVLPPPASPAAGVYPLLYGTVNFIALNFGHAKNVSAPTVQKPPVA